MATNRIDLDPTVRDVRGFPVARYTYAPHRHELAAAAHHGPRLAAILKEMGAEWTSVVTSPGTAGGPAEKSTPEAPMSRHVMGTVRMGEDPATSVADTFGRLHQLPNVVIADSSVFVTSSGYGPTLHAGRPGRPGRHRHDQLSRARDRERRSRHLATVGPWMTRDASHWSPAHHRVSGRPPPGRWPLRGSRWASWPRRSDRLAEVLADCQAHAPDSRSWVADLSDPDPGAAAVAGETWDAFGHLDILV